MNDIAAALPEVDPEENNSDSDSDSVTDSESETSESDSEGIRICALSFTYQVNALEEISMVGLTEQDFHWRQNSNTRRIWQPKECSQQSKVSSVLLNSPDPQ